MSLRITDNTIGSTLVSDLQTSYKRLANLQEQISSGYRVNRPSDDPLAAAQARLQRSDLAGVAADQASVNSASTLLTAQETSLTSVNDLLSRAKELALQGANGTYAQTNRDAMATEVDQLIASVKDAMNANVAGAFVFSGTKSDATPYAAATGDAYQGDNGAVLRSAGPGVTLQANPTVTPIGGTATPLTADAITGGGSTAGDGRVLDTLQQLAAHLRGGTAADLTALSTTVQASLDANITAVSSARSAIGAMTNRATAASSRLSDLSDAATQSISDLTGVDLAKALTDYTQQQSSYQAALKVGAQIIQPSLLDFLS